jgi:type I restriction enzyme S subunit
MDNYWNYLKLVEFTNPDGLMCDGDWIESKDQDPHGEVRLIQLADIGDGFFLNKSSRYLTYNKAKDLNCTFLNNGDILVARMPDPIGRACIFTDIGRPAISVVDVCIIRVNNSVVNRWLMYVINSKLIRNEIISRRGGSTRPRIARRELEALEIPTPPFSEQMKIADTLSTWDRAIERVQRLIEAKQRQKKGLMQGLLTGKLRFPEFGEPVDTEGDLPSGWNKTKLKNVADIIVSNVDKLTNENESDVLLCNYMDVYSNEYITSKIVFMRATASQPEISKYRLVRGDVLLTKDSETSEDIASTAVLMEDIDDLICGYHLAILRPKKDLVNPVFLSKHLSFGNAHKHFVTHANGVTRYGLSLSSVINTPIFLPCLDEQTKIADLIMEIDREITIYSQILEMYTHQKKGLMQKLLTGEIRVKVG